MHSEIENLINMALADGEVTEKERAIILRKAESLGLDYDEVEMILDGKIVLMQQDQGIKQSIQSTNKEGKVIKCPSCGAAVKSFQEECSECDYIFRFDSLNILNKEIQGNLESRIYQISSHNIPINKEALVEFLSFSMGNSKNKGLSFEERSAWFAKFTEAYHKAMFSFKSDSDVKFLEGLDSDKDDVDYDLSRTDAEKQRDDQEAKDAWKNPLIWVSLGFSFLMLYGMYKLIRLLF